MTANPFRITLHMVSSLDGMIAKKDNSVSWFETADVYEKGVSEQNTAEVLNRIDCYIMGSRTYEHARELSRSYGWAYGDTPTIVVTNRNLPVERANVELCSGAPGKLVNELLKPRFKNIWLVGGPTLAKSFIQEKLVDEVRMSVLPVMLGEGTPFFEPTGQEQTLHLKDVTAFRSGMVELWYEIKK